MMPPSMFGGNHDENGHYTEFDTEIWEDQTMADMGFDVIDAWSDGSGFTPEEWMDSITNVYNEVYDDEGRLIGFDFDYETDDGYSGSRHAGARG